MNIKKIAETLNISIEDAEQMLKDDKRIDRGEKLYSLSEEKEKNSKQMRSIPRKVGVKQNRKPDLEKQKIIEVLLDAVYQNFGPDFMVSNAEREFTFNFKNKKYKVVLSCPRS